MTCVCHSGEDNSLVDVLEESWVRPTAERDLTSHGHELALGLFDFVFDVLLHCEALVDGDAEIFRARYSR